VQGLCQSVIALLKPRFELVVADCVRFTAGDVWARMGSIPMATGNTVLPPPVLAAGQADALEQPVCPG
jgi:hypothetical protein